MVVRSCMEKTAHSDFTLVNKDRSIAGTTRLDSRVFKLQSVGDNEHFPVEINSERLPPD
jgi:hypothetical protein